MYLLDLVKLDKLRRSILYALMLIVVMSVQELILSRVTIFGARAMIMPLFPIVFAGGYVVVFATLMTIVNRLKYGKFWENTLIWVWGGKALRLCLRLIKKLLSGLDAVIRAIPMMWKALAVTAAAVLIEFIIFLLGVDGSESEALLLFIIFHAAVIAAAVKLLLDMLKLQNEAQALASGELDKKVDTSRMLGELKKHGENLNSIGEGAAIAADRQLRSERLKAELITNVSHDIKTPLTSIVNYVDLLKKEKLEGKAAEYVEVLDRQSARLKKLTVDLVDASKASTGNMPVDMQRTNVCEVVRQAAGEYVERLDKEKLELVVDTPQPTLMIMADGRLLWRVIDNLLSNVCKYALAGTRVYIDLGTRDNRGVVSMKNISRDQLNVNADELMERFVRGDTSRHTEGSGLGLNIAKSLMELMGGTFALSVDGDLFKAELTLRQVPGDPSSAPIE